MNSLRTDCWAQRGGKGPWADIVSDAGFRVQGALVISDGQIELVKSVKSDWSNRMWSNLSMSPPVQLGKKPATLREMAQEAETARSERVRARRPFFY